MSTDAVRVELSGLSGKDALVVEGILSHEGREAGVTIKDLGVGAGIDPMGVSLVLGIIYLGAGVSAYVAKVIFSIRRQLTAFSVVDLRDGQVKIVVDGNNKAMAGKTLIISDTDDRVTIDEDRGLNEIASALEKSEIEE